MSIKEMLDLGLHIVPIIVGLIMAVIKIGNMIDTKMDVMKNEFKKSIDDLWSSQSRQDASVAALAKDHYRLEGRLGITGKGMDAT